ncbi:MAG: hypothetical protein WBP37_18170, partial [Candidatus Dechloromonas phosphoritropha]
DEDSGLVKQQAVVLTAQSHFIDMNSVLHREPTIVIRCFNLERKGLMSYIRLLLSHKKISILSPHRCLVI